MWNVFRVSPFSPASFGLVNVYSPSVKAVIYGNSAYMFAEAPDDTNSRYFPVAVEDNQWRVVRFAKQGARRIVQIDGITYVDAMTTAGSYSDVSANLYLGWWNGVYTLGGHRHVLFIKNAILDDATAAKLTTYLAEAK